jgi:hypothetical protein
LNCPPTTGGDEPDYDSLGWELSHGRGYQFNFADPGFRAPYDAAARDQPELYFLMSTRVGATAYRPPLFPLVIAGTDVLLGRQFWGIRLINGACVAATCGLVAHVVWRMAGLAPALLGAFVFVVIDYRTRLYSRAILTEAIACVLVALLALALTKSARTQRLYWAGVAGIVAGLGVLARNMMAAWLPGIALIIYLVARRSWPPIETTGTPDRDTSGPRPAPAPRRRALAAAGVFLAATVAVLLPWMVRNCVALGAFMPLGIQGLNELSAGYSDVAFATGGVWSNAATRGFFDPIKNPGLPSLAQERTQARYSSGQAKRWVLENPGKALLLAPLKVFHEFRPRSPSEWFILGLALVGLVQLAQGVEGWVFGGLLLTNVVAVAVTWSVEGRFLVPLLFVFHVLAAVGLWSTLLVPTKPFPYRSTRRSSSI